MKWKTDLILSPSLQPFGLSDSIFTIGSCFAETIGNRLVENKFKALVNPFGTLYNPLSIHQQLKSTIDDMMPPNQGYLVNQDVHYHYQYHSSFSSLDKEGLKEKIKHSLQTANQFLKTSNYLIITYGSAFIYRKNETNEFVANCHKMPASDFTKELLTVQDIADSFFHIHRTLKSFNPNLKIILTVSPVRHLKDTIELNSVSKSTLRLACHQLAEKFDVDYFPAYEIMMDDLRDYRFYRTDRIHPTQEAEEYIWGKFSEKYFDQRTMDFLETWREINTALAHRPSYPSTVSHQVFLKSVLRKLEELKNKIDVSKEVNQVRSQLIS
ncbi:MAG: GSCFA domain-containing protein [Cyclobacteriaceae bacterium]